MTELQELTTKRKQIKSTTTRFITFLKKFKDTDNVRTLQTRLTDFKPLLAQYNEVQSRIESLEETEETDERADYEKSYYDAITLAEETIEKKTVVASSKATEIKLPTIDLPNFSGDYTEWTAFYDSFVSLIHENKNLEKIQKLHYLRSCLGKDARRTIDTLAVSAENYEVAWKLLKNRYQNKRLIVQHHIHALFNLKPVTKTCPTSLRTLLDELNAHLESLKAQKLETDKWDAMVVYLITTKIDFLTKREWESKLEPDKLPTIEDMTTFLTQRCQTLESIEFGSGLNKQKSQETNKRTNSAQITVSTSCIKCKQTHLLHQCPEFLQLNVKDRVVEVKRLKLCNNCLRSNHDAKNCQSRTCKNCNGKHHTLLHFPRSETNQNTNNTKVNNHCTSGKITDVLLSTALIKIKDANGHYHKAKALLDIGSQQHFIREDFCKKLGLKLKSTNIPISGINQSISKITRATEITFKSQNDRYTAQIQCLVLPKITNDLPLETFDPTNCIIVPEGLDLADPEFYLSSAIDLLIGAPLFYDLLRDGKIKLNDQKTYAQNSTLGWLIEGPFTTVAAQENSKSSCHVVSNLEKQILKFWETEQYENNQRLSPDDEMCENLFRESFQRNSDGRFIVSLPFKNNPVNIGDTKAIAIKRFKCLETKLNKSPHLKTNYDNFLSEYLDLDHMERVNPRESTPATLSYYLPHHPVIKETSISTKTRVVFDASSKSSNGLSLNDNLYIGPNLQTDLFSLIVRSRVHKFVLSADIVKMFRQILVNKADRDFLRILYRQNSKQPIETFRLKTVTYGLNCAPFLAIRCLHELAHQVADEYPRASKVILNSFYMDDLLVGIDTLEEAIKLRDDLIHVLRQGGFELGKWASNKRDLLPIGANHLQNNSTVQFNPDSDTKTLGLTWNYSRDVLKYQVAKINVESEITKRIVLSTIAQIFDPLGLLAPILVTAKIILQKLWQLNLSWDKVIPSDLRQKFDEFRKQLHLIDNLEIPRNAISFENEKHINIQIHGFCDASKEAYGAAIYIKCISQNGEHAVNLLCSKSRIAPLKILSIPRLELCAALLLAKLVSKVIKTIDIQFENCFLWSDSMVVLAWISASPNKWQSFVAHRVSDIQTLTEIQQWHYVNTRNNPADLMTRGILPGDTTKIVQWLKGPTWLLKEQQEWPQQPTDTCEINILEKKSLSLICTSNKLEELPLLCKILSYPKLKRIMGYCLRFINSRKKDRKIGNLTCEELVASNKLILKLVQQSAFHQEITELKNTGTVNNKSSLISLNVFLDGDGLIRVGGRLQNANIEYEKKHQILLPKSHHVTKLIIRDIHEQQLHSGTQATLAAVRQTLWPIAGRNAVKQIIRTCVKCYRVKPVPYQQMMGNLPGVRVNPARAFINCGVDYMGPIQIKEGRGRGKRSIKSYVALFVCLVTKAIHLELVLDYTAESFINALKRMMARRGIVANLYSDNGSNFVGANRELKELQELLQSDKFNSVENFLTNKGINWHFIPPHAPHMGGIWEAGVKSCKSHFKRVAGKVPLTYDEMYTLLTLIESCLNSRPITPLSNDPNDMDALTPGHFLIGTPLTAPLEPNLVDLPRNRLSRWQLVERLRQQWWMRWSIEYLHQLQSRTKWRTRSSVEIAPGTMVVLQEEKNVPPLHWKLGRIQELHQGADGIPRVVTIKTINGLVKRAVQKVCVLPIEF